MKTAGNTKGWTAMRQGGSHCGRSRKAAGNLVKIEDYAHNVGRVLSLPYDGGTHHLKAMVRFHEGAWPSPLWKWCETDR